MHPRNPYSNLYPRFDKLAESYPYLKKHLRKTVNGDLSLTFSEPETCRDLTKATLHKDFGLNIYLPKGHLIPTVPGRLDYILWIEDLISYSSTDLMEQPIYGIDIGTGASSIYPLIGAKKNDNWQFFASDVDAESCNYANENIRENGLEDRITVIHNPNKENILSAVLDCEKAKDVKFTFCMTNPPFYNDPSELASSRQLKGDDSCPADGPLEYTESEYFFKGGEAGFVKIMIDESLRFRERCLWYTSMISKKSNLKPLLKILRSFPEILTVHWERFIQGSTSRWFIAWSYAKINIPPKPKKAKVVTMKVIRLRAPEGSDPEDILKSIVIECEELLNIAIFEGDNRYQCRNTHNRWSRKSRRGQDPEECPFEFTISAEKDSIEFGSSSLSPHFESLISHLQRKHHLRK